MTQSSLSTWPRCVTSDYSGLRAVPSCPSLTHTSRPTNSAFRLQNTDHSGSMPSRGLSLLPTQQAPPAWKGKTTKLAHLGLECVELHLHAVYMSWGHGSLRTGTACQWQTLICRSGIAEGYAMRHCTVQLDLPCVSGFVTDSSGRSFICRSEKHRCCISDRSRQPHLESSEHKMSINCCKFKVCNSMHHRTIQINHQHDSTVFQFIILIFVYSSTCFGRSPAHHQELNDCSGGLWFYLRIVVIAMLCS
jgi:hypothetical protein